MSIIANRIARGKQPCLDSGHLGKCADPQTRDQFGFQRPGAAELADSCQNSIQLAKNENRPLDSFGLPTCDRLECGQNFVKPLP